MEQGQLPSAGVSSVLQALAEIVGSSAEALRDAGETFGEGSGGGRGSSSPAAPTPDATFEVEALAPPASPGTERISDGP